MAKEKVVKEPKPKVQLTITGIQKDLKDGIDRRGIALKYGLSMADVSRLFQNPKLKGLKVKTTGNFELVDDTVEGEAEQEDTSKQAEAGTETKAELAKEEAPAKAKW